MLLVFIFNYSNDCNSSWYISLLLKSVLCTEFRSTVIAKSFQYRTHAKNRTAPKPHVARDCMDCKVLYGFQGARLAKQKAYNTKPSQLVRCTLFILVVKYFYGASITVGGCPLTWSIQFHWKSHKREVLLMDILEVIALISLCIACIKLGMEINKNTKK